MATKYQHGGWYDNPATGKNERFMDGAFQSAPAGPSVYQQNFDKISGEVNKYVDELVKQAQGDFDFAAKWIENAYKVARGSDQGAQAEFLKKVANTLEEKVGRIAFDYQTQTYRVNQDADIATSRTIQGRDMALRRLSEDEQTFRKQFAQQTEVEREQQDGSLNARGIYSAPRSEQGGLAGREIGRLETDISNRLSAYERQLGRGKEDIGIGSEQKLADIGLFKNRGLDDLTTTSRRGAIDADMERDSANQENLRKLEERKQAAERERRAQLNQASVYANYLSRPA